jgi:hypothetical protein
MSMDLSGVSGFLHHYNLTATIRHDIIEILLKVALNTMTLTSNLKTITLMNDYEIIMYCFVTYGYLLPSLGVRLFGLGVSEENIKM